MKLLNIMEAGNFNISEEDLERVFQVVSKRELDQRDIKGIANELVDEGGFSRSPGSAQFAINRMHILIHGIAPHGYTEKSAETMFQAAKPLVDFMVKKGYDAEENTRRARIELKSRVQKVSQAEATQRMSDFYKAHKDSMNKKKRRSLNRNDIIRDIMAGEPEEKAFRMNESTGLLKELVIKDGFDAQSVADTLVEYAIVVEGFIDHIEMLCENDAPSASMEEALDIVLKQMEAAKRGLGIVNRLRPGPDKAKHASRVLSNMNRIRGSIRRIEKGIASLAQDADRNSMADGSSNSRPRAGGMSSVGSVGVGSMGLRSMSNADGVVG